MSQVRVRTRQYCEGWLGRRRWYNCRACGRKFQVDTLKPLPEAERLCPVHWLQAKQEGRLG